MSADNWTVCPNCHKSYLPEASPYGKVSESEYVAWVDKKAQIEDEEPRTMREDWELNLDLEFNLFIKYSCLCTECGWSYEIRIDKNVEKGGKIEK